MPLFFLMLLYAYINYIHCWTKKNRLRRRIKPSPDKFAILLQSRPPTPQALGKMQKKNAESEY